MTSDEKELRWLMEHGTAVWVVRDDARGLEDEFPCDGYATGENAAQDFIDYHEDEYPYESITYCVLLRVQRRWKWRCETASEPAGYHEFEVPGEPPESQNGVSP